LAALLAAAALAALLGLVACLLAALAPGGGALAVAGVGLGGPLLHSAGLRRAAVGQPTLPAGTVQPLAAQGGRDLATRRGQLRRLVVRQRVPAAARRPLRLLDLPVDALRRGGLRRRVLRLRLGRLDLDVEQETDGLLLQRLGHLVEHVEALA